MQQRPPKSGGARHAVKNLQKDFPILLQDLNDTTPGGYPTWDGMSDGLRRVPEGQYPDAVCPLNKPSVPASCALLNTGKRCTLRTRGFIQM